MSKDLENDHLDSEIEEQDINPNEEERTPWNRRFGTDENLKNRQYSRTARNQPAKEATTLSKVLLLIIFITVLAPFILFFIVDATRDNDEITNRTAQEISISKSIEISESADEQVSESEESSSAVASESSSVESISRESIESVSEPVQSVTVPEPTVPEVPVEVPVTPETPETTGTVYTVSASDSWWSISQAFGVDVYSLAAANGATIETPIYPGDTIIIP